MGSGRPSRSAGRQARRRNLRGRQPSPDAAGAARRREADTRIESTNSDPGPMPAEVKGTYWKIFATRDLSTSPGLRLLQDLRRPLLNRHVGRGHSPSRPQTVTGCRRPAAPRGSPILWRALGVATMSLLWACRSVVDTFHRATFQTAGPTDLLLSLRLLLCALARGSRHDYMSMTKNLRARQGSRGRTPEFAEYGRLYEFSVRRAQHCGTVSSGPCRIRERPAMSTARSGRLRRVGASP